VSKRDAIEDALRDAAQDAFMVFSHAEACEQAALWAANCDAQARYEQRSHGCTESDAGLPELPEQCHLTAEHDLRVVGTIKADIIQIHGREYLFDRPAGAFRQLGYGSDGADPITDTKGLSVHGSLLTSATL
jgi:hypothetical protein